MILIILVTALSEISARGLTVINIYQEAVLAIKFYHSK